MNKTDVHQSHQLTVQHHVVFVFVVFLFLT